MHYVDKLQKHLKELKQEGGISGPLEPEWARGWISNPVIVVFLWATNTLSPTFTILSCAVFLLSLISFLFSFSCWSFSLAS